MKISFLVLVLIICFLSGGIAERLHYGSIKKREKDLVDFPLLTTGKNDPCLDDAAGSFLVYGNCVISMDYFKAVLGKLSNLFGGEMISYDSLLDRARREAVIRIKENAMSLGCDMVLNARFECTGIGKQSGLFFGSKEVMIYGTGVVLKKK